MFLLHCFHLALTLFPSTENAFHWTSSISRVFFYFNDDDHVFKNESGEMQNSTHSESLCKLTTLIPSVMKVLTENLFLYDLCRTWLCACVKAAETQTTLFTSVIWSRRIFNRALLKLPAVILIVMNCISNWKRSKVVTHLEKTGRQNSGLCERCIKFKHQL